MSWIENMSINIFPMVLVMVVFVSNRFKFGKTISAKVFDLIIVFDFFLMLVDIVGVAVTDAMFTGIAGSVWIINVVRMVLTVLLTGTWFIYVCLKISMDGADRRVWAAVYASLSLMAIVCFVVLLIPHSYLGTYGLQNAGRGLRICYRVISYYGIAMFACSAAVAVYGIVHERDKELRRLCIYLMLFSALPVLGVVLQSINQNLRTSSPCLSLAVLYVYVTMQNKKVITDGLTGINNRRELDAYLERRLKQRTEWGMLLIDVDDFKKINDTIGHKIGDEALWHVADILRTEFSGDGCFVARYGGDEFVICGEWKNRAELEQCIASIQKRVDSFNMEKERNYKLSLSVGAALWSECADSEASIVELADRSMYKQKQIHKERRNAGSEQYSIYSG